MRLDGRLRRLEGRTRVDTDDSEFIEWMQSLSIPAGESACDRDPAEEDDDQDDDNYEDEKRVRTQCSPPLRPTREF
jgi:hypothetical protein